MYLVYTKYFLVMKMIQILLLPKKEKQNTCIFNARASLIAKYVNEDTQGYMNEFTNWLSQYCQILMWWLLSEEVCS